ncbi:Ig-like domain-containing protein [Vibrio aestuarianus]|uniref:Ig-like domain-containing protein n=1 Tax=Vibrio aestuarianus TaxID=28171 RepID=UPI00237C8835|nr:Ig-like domain-containing protein [Vibrio aestuarianus]MDE1238535.1 Ig-like domain-containing protein [Vibrio aestuarianus]
MNKYFKSLFAIVIFPLLMLLTGCNSEGALSSIVKLERIDIVASPITTQGVSQLTLAVGNKQPFEAVGHYSDGSSHPLTGLTVSDWHTSNSEVGRFDEPGVLTAVEVGNTTLTATKDGVTSNTVNVNVSAAVITSIQVTPSPVNIAKGQTQQLTATATFDDGTSSDISSSVTWGDFDTATVTVSLAGLLSAVEAGNTTLTATKDGITSNTVDVNVSAAVITAIQVTPSPVNVAKGQTQQLTATATFDDGTSSDISSSVTWGDFDTATVTVSLAGLLSAVEAGNTTLTATKDGITSNTVDVNVSAAVIAAIQVTPSPVNVAKGQTQQLTATATFSDATSSDISSSVTWTPIDMATATVSPSGLLSAVEVGNTTLTATKDGITSNTVTVNVCSDLAGICIDVLDTGSGKLFTSSPSEVYLDSIGGSATIGIYPESGSDGPTGNFYLFDWNNANALCTTYNTHSLGGRTNWILATKDELKTELYDVFGNMFTARGWPATIYYWSETPDVSSYYAVNLRNGFFSTDFPSSSSYVSCVSNP